MFDNKREVMEISMTDDPEHPVRVGVSDAANEFMSPGEMLNVIDAAITELEKLKPHYEQQIV